MNQKGGKAKIDKDTIDKMVSHIEGQYNYGTWE